MAIVTERLNYQRIKALKPQDKAKTYTDGNGLVLVVRPNGTKLWWFRYPFPGVLSEDSERGKKGDPAILRKTLSLGTWPDVGEKLARELAQKAREQLARGIDPNEEKKKAKFILQFPTEKTDKSFRAIADEWLKRKKPSVTPTYFRIVKQRLEDYIFPSLGNVPIDEITPQMLESVLKRHESKGVFETINRTNKYCSEIFRYGYARPAGRVCENDPADVIHQWLLKPTKRTYPTIADERNRDKSFKELLLDIENYPGRDLEKYGLMLMAHTFVRTNPLVQAEWSEFDFVQKEWHIPSEKMKGTKDNKKPLLVPLSRQVIAILKKLKAVSGHSKYLFPHRSDVNGHASENMLLKGLERMGWHGKMSGHGFRHIASTTLNEYKEKWGIHEDWIEIQIAHSVKSSSSRGIYNLAKYIDDRRKMLQRWSDFIDELTGKKTARAV